MSDLVVAGHVTRDELSEADLPLVSAGVCEVVSYAPGGVTKRRARSKSATVKGGIQRASVADIRQVDLTLRIFGSTKAALDTNVATYQAAFDQFSYQLSITLGNGTVLWQCDDAEWDLAGGEVDKYRLMATPKRQLWVFHIPVQPDPVSGVF